MNDEQQSNHLRNEKSPYLQQHAGNPVDWYPWGKEPFERARVDDKPIFLSIGYSTCHWCHVMEEESFSNPDIAQLMNALFVCVKVDREELPDVDSLYMEFAQSMLGGAAGWPLNMVLTTDLRPFYAATYLPPTSKHGLIGVRELCARIREIWNGEERQLVQEQAQEVLEAFVGSTQYIGDHLPDELDLENAAELLYKIADPVYGGIQGAPKFPIGYQHLFLLRHFFSSRDPRALFCAEKALQMMHRGGIYDHLGGGFARYAVDEQWLIPHFEKMLYDNALLAEAYTKVWQVTRKEEYRRVATETLDYLLRDMRQEDGGFYSAEDADSEGKEGRFYTWTPNEIVEALGEEHAFFFCDYFGVTQEGNFDEGRSVLHTPHDLEEIATIQGRDPKELAGIVEKQRRLLFQKREERERPFRDDKILTAWNGLLIHTLAHASAAFDRQDYLQAAEKAANFILQNLWVQGQLLRRWRDGEARFDGGLEEYAYFIRGLLTLFEVTGKWDYLDRAVDLTTLLENRFKVQDGAFYQTNGADGNLIFRKANFADGAEPSGNAVHTENLLRLYALTKSEGYLMQAEEVLRAFQANVEDQSIGFCYHLLALQRYLDRKAPIVVIALGEEEGDQEKIKKMMFARYLPNRAIIWAKGSNPLFPEQLPIENQTTLYICSREGCQEPVVGLSAIKEALHEL